MGRDIHYVAVKPDGLGRRKEDFHPGPGLILAEVANPRQRTTIIENMYGLLLYYSEQIDTLVGYLDYVKIEGRSMFILKNGLKGLAKASRWWARRCKVEVKR